jgi:pteridine reductase
VGSALATMLADRGVSVALSYLKSRETIERTVAAVRLRGVGGLATCADLSNPEEAQRGIEETVAAFGRIDLLVSMASVYRRTPFATTTPGDFDAMIAANLAGPYHTAVAAARHMLTQPGEDGIRGKIVFVGDWATERPYPDYLPYLVAKGGLSTLTVALARELAPHITVNLVQPAMIDPPPNLTESERAAVVAATPLRRAGSAGDLNRLILYLLEGTDFATGSIFRVDGGRFLGDS